ncbi:MAG: hemolysin III family protein [Spirochaetaceae bacterium]
MINSKKWLLKNITLHTHDNKTEEFFNGLTHLLGIILSIIGLVLLFLKETQTIHFKGATIVYGFTMLLLFSASTAYHWLKDPVLKRIGRILDHCNIYLLIAGTYTPIAFYVGGKFGITIIIVEWSLTILGILFTLRFWGKLKPLHIVFYLLMGWMIVFIWSDFILTVPKELSIMIIIGGLFYTLGVIIYALKKVPFYHAVWHLFVVGGASSMFLGIYKYLS